MGGGGRRTINSLIFSPLSQVRMFMPDCERIAADHSASVNPSVAPAACSSALSSDQALVMELMLRPGCVLSPAKVPALVRPLVPLRPLDVATSLTPAASRATPTAAEPDGCAPTCRRWWQTAPLAASNPNNTNDLIDCFITSCTT